MPANSEKALIRISTLTVDLIMITVEKSYCFKPLIPLLLKRKKSRQNEEYLAYLNNMEVFTAFTKSLG